jgi:phosphoadenosine phosphosulfate reductase
MSTSTRPTHDPPGAAELDEAGRLLEDAPAEEIVAWAHENFGSGLVVASSFEDPVLVDIATRSAPGAPILFVDTGFHFPETLAYVEQLRSRYGLDLEIARSDVDRATSPCGAPDCCVVRKVEPISAALEGRQAWITGLRRTDSPGRAGTPVVEWDQRFGLAKISPLARWTDADIDAYVTERDLPWHPLRAQGYRSIGCAPTTRPTTAGEDPRAGRWPGQEKTECGLHG